MNLITTNIKNINTELQSLAKRYELKHTVTLMAVSKGVEADKIEEAIVAGVVNFGENYLQEALTKWPMLKIKYPHVKLHFIGGLQSNKLKKILELFNVIQSIDSFDLIDKIVKSNNSNREFFIEVKVANSYSDNRKGVAINLAQRLIEYAKNKELNLTGVMGIAPLVNNEDERNYKDETSVVAQFFRQLQQLQQEFNLPNLSMGMSNDYKKAIKYGSTMVRIGSKIFGSRN